MISPIRNAMLAGLKLIPVIPIKTYTTVKRLGKSKVGKRWVKVRRHTGYSDPVQKGKPLYDVNQRAVYLHQHDYDKVRREIEHQAAKAMAVPQRYLGF
ncbi:hypothetical protein [Vibrio owensii]|uniref:hypothetical protein n=1 Tax=Vibrio owensii TaxID=696485 RepID=UPI003CE4D41B